MLQSPPMNHIIRIPLDGTPEQIAQLLALQAAFADACNAIAPVVQSTRCWNRVALHHLVYRTMRERFPALGSQMICNAVYSVSRTARLVLQHPGSPFNVAKQPPNSQLPLLRFGPTAPVYFDRHTLSVKGNVLSIFTLDGRVPFALQLQPTEIARFHTEKLLVTALTGDNRGFRLTFQFASPDSRAADAGAPAKADAKTRDDHNDKRSEAALALPGYLTVIPDVDHGAETSTANVPSPEITIPPIESPAVETTHSQPRLS